VILSAKSIFSFISNMLAQAKGMQGFSSAKNHRTLPGGYGQTHRGLGDTETRVPILQHGYNLTEE
jgi:hypothetical protein